MADVNEDSRSQEAELCRLETWSATRSCYGFTVVLLR